MNLRQKHSIFYQKNYRHPMLMQDCLNQFIKDKYKEIYYPNNIDAEIAVLLTTTPAYQIDNLPRNTNSLNKLLLGFQHRFHQGIHFCST